MMLVLDNYDSFTYNLVQYLGEMNVPMQVHRNDEITIDRAKAASPTTSFAISGAKFRSSASASATNASATPSAPKSSSTTA